MAVALRQSGALDWIQVVEMALNGALTLGTAPIAPGTFVLRWIARGCGPIDGALREQFAVYHDILLAESVLWGVVGTAVAGATAIEVAGVSIPAVAAVEAVLLGLTYLTAALATGRWPGAAALLPLTAAGGWVVWLANLVGLDASSGQAMMRTPDVARALAREKAKKKIGGTVELELNPDRSGPMFLWSTAVPPEVTARSGSTSLALAYGHAYQRAAEEAYRADPAVDLRPWLGSQAGVDAAYLVAKRAAAFRAFASAAGAGRAREIALTRAALVAIDEATRRLANWRAATAGPPPGAWPRASVLRVLRSSTAETGVDVVDDEQSGTVGGGNSSAIVGVLAALAAGYAVLR